jgi:hypothetical protein
MEKFDKVYDVEIKTYIRIAYNKELVEYVQSLEFKKYFYDLFRYGENPEEFLKFIALISMGDEKLSDIEGFSENHDKMYRILGSVDYEVDDVVDMSDKIRWELE